MVTRFYFPWDSTPDVTPSTWSVGWNKTNGQFVGTGALPNITAKMNTTKLGSAGDGDVHNAALSGASAEFIAIRRFVSHAIDAQTVTGTITGQFRCLENSGNLNATLAFAVKIVQPDGSDRGVLLAVTASDDTSTAPPEFVTSGLTNRPLQDSTEATTISLGSVAASAGDFIVVEVGYREVNTNTGRNASVGFNDDNATDLTAGDTTETTTLNPWVQFSQTILFQAAPSRTLTKVKRVESRFRRCTSKFHSGTTQYRRYTTA